MESFERVQAQLIREIEDERRAEIERFRDVTRATDETAQRKLEQALERLPSIGVDRGALEESWKASEDESARELDEIRKRYAGDVNAPKRITSEHFQNMALDAAIVPASGRGLPTAYASIFSTKDAGGERAGGTGTDVPNYSVIDAWDWASGGGSGLFGSGAGSYQVWIEFGFWFRPETNKFYGIIPHNLFRGYYIVRADDGFFTSKEARAVVDVWTNVWQYNWKGWTQNRILDVGGDNIDVNNRFDTDRHTYNTALLGASDWAYIRNYVSLYVYARGGGSYSELNFSIGAANYLSCPHAHVY